MRMVWMVGCIELIACPGVAKMRPGFTNADAADAIIAKIGEHGLDEHLFNLFIGHGIGMGGGVRIEDTVLVTDGDARILSRVEYEERLLL